MGRKEELLKIIGDESLELSKQMVEEAVFLEGKLIELKKLPFIKVNPKNPLQQKVEPAAKLYKEFLQQYINCIKMIENIIYQEKRLQGEEVKESPLREWKGMFDHDMDAG